MDDLVVWLGAQLDEDERIARAACKYASPEWHLDEEFGETVLWWPPEFHTPYEEDKHWRGQALDGRLAPHIAEHDPARVLREIDAKRKLLAEHDVYGRKLGEGMDCQSLDFPCLTLRLLATVYRDRPGYRTEEWAP